MDSLGHEELYKCWLAAFKRAVENPEIKQNKMAVAVGNTPEHISMVLNEKRRASPELQEKIAKYLGTAVMEMSRKGYMLRHGEEFYQPQRNSTASNIVSEVANLVYELAQVKENAAYWQSIVELMTDGVIITDLDNVIIYQNKAHRAITGESAIGKSCADTSFCQKVLDGDCPADMAKNEGRNVSIKRKVGKKNYLITAYPLFNMSGQVKQVVRIVKEIN